MSKPENNFPTIRDLRDSLSDLIERGLAEHPVQIVVVPASTMEAIARSTPGYDAQQKPALMIEFSSTIDRLPVSFISTAYLDDNKPRRVETH